MPQKTLILRVPGRRPADWNDHLSESDRAVFFSDVRDNAELTPDGRHLSPGAPSACLVFDSLDEAQTFSLDLVQRIPHIKCEIYDRRGAAAGPVAIFTNDLYHRSVPTRRSAYWLIAAGIVLFALGPIFIYYDWLYSGGLIYPTLIGLNCFLLALRLFYMAHATFHASRRHKGST